jgi:hypothetical protein
MTSSFISSSCLIYGIGQSARCITPKSSTTKHFYEAFLRQGGGRGFLRSFYFHDPIDCTVFLDAVDTLKGP